MWRNHLKGLVERLPYSVGHGLTFVPFKYRLGPEYTKFQALLAANPQVGPDYVVDHFNRIFQYAKQRFPFYREHYAQHGVLDLEIRTLDDIRRVPTVTKALLRANLDSFDGAMKINTGGTSGTPFYFFVDKDAFAREWAHMHYIWSLRNYTYTEPKLTFRGKNLGSRSIVYNPVHNEFMVNTYHPVSRYVDELVALVQKRSIRFLHGYPSAIYLFFKEFEATASESQKAVLRANLKSCLLASEFPLPYMTEYLGGEWGLDYISWYGHSEMCVLAYDQTKSNRYVPFQSYGFAEDIDGLLVGTSYHNYDMPLIRYETGDLVEPHYGANGLMEYFRVKEGRNGDFIADASGKLIPLTGLIFGRHHEIFRYAKTIQVSQDEPGRAAIYVTGVEGLAHDELLPLLDTTGVDIEFDLVVGDEPYFTPLGKMPLKIPPQPRK